MEQIDLSPNSPLSHKVDGYYRLVLNQKFHEMKQGNPNFTLRSYARYLNIQAPTLSHILKGNRPLPYRKLDPLLKKLNLDSTTARKFTQSVQVIAQRKKKPTQKVQYEKTLGVESQYRKLISDGDYFTFLSYLNLPKASHQHQTIARRMGVEKDKIDQIVLDLLMLGHIKKAGERYIRVYRSVTTVDEVPREEIKKAHIDTLKAAAKKLYEIPIDLRDYGSIKFNCNLENIPQVKVEVRRFLSRVYRLLNEGDCTEVYECAVQIFPRTQNKAEEDINKK